MCQWEILTFFGQNSITFDRETRLWRDFFLKMQVISVAFRLAIYEFWGLESELLGVLSPGQDHQERFSGKASKLRSFILKNKSKLQTNLVCLFETNACAYVCDKRILKVSVSINLCFWITLKWLPFLAFPKIHENSSNFPNQIVSIVLNWWKWG